MTQSITIF